MKKTKLKYIAAFMLIFSPGAVSAMPWSWDMFTQPSHKAQEDQAPPRPQGTVQFRAVPASYKDRAEAVRVANPVAPTKESLERGRLQYNTYCAPCHGDTGKGDGLVGQKYVAPTDLTDGYVQTKPDGDIYYTIVNGGLAIMPSYGDSVPGDDRWHIVNYIKHNLKKGK